MTTISVTADPAIPTTFTVTTSTSEFDFDWPWWDSGDIIVRVDGVALASSAYTVSGGPNDGTVTLNSAVDDVTVEIDRLVVADLTSGLSLTGALSVSALNSQLARLTARDQDIARQGAVVSTLTQTLTIASDAITVDGAYVPNLITLDTQAAASTDNLATINGGNAGQTIFLQATSAARVITVKDGTGNIQLPGGDFVLDSTSDMLMLVKSGTIWRAPAAGANNA